MVWEEVLFRRRPIARVARASSSLGRGREYALYPRTLRLLSFRDLFRRLDVYLNQARRAFGGYVSQLGALLHSVLLLL